MYFPIIVVISYLTLELGSIISITDSMGTAEQLISGTYNTPNWYYTFLGGGPTMCMPDGPTADTVLHG